MTNVALAGRIALPPSPCLRRVKRPEAAGVTKGCRAVLDREAAGLGMTVFVAIKVGQHSRAHVQASQDALAAMPEVVSCHMVPGTADRLAEVVPDRAASEALLTARLLTLPVVTDVRSSISLRRIKSDTPLPLPGG